MQGFFQLSKLVSAAADVATPGLLWPSECLHISEHPSLAQFWEGWCVSDDYLGSPYKLEALLGLWSFYTKNSLASLSRLSQRRDPSAPFYWASSHANEWPHSTGSSWRESLALIATKVLCLTSILAFQMKVRTEDQELQFSHPSLMIHL